jgi:hypothetical protein
MRFILIGGCVIAVVVVVILTAGAWTLRPFPSLVYGPNTEIEVDGGGAIYQGPQQVGQFHEQDGKQVAHVRLLVPNEESQPVSEVVSMVFHSSKDVAHDVLIHPISIQGEGSITYSWLSKVYLTVHLIKALPDAYPTLELSAPSGFFSLPILLRILDWVYSFSLQVWAGVTALFLIVIITYTSLRSRKPTWKMEKERATSPGDLKPIELALIHHGSIRPIDLAALLYNLTERGYLQILDRGEREVLFLRTAKQEGLANYERNFLLLLFPDATHPVHLEGIIEGLNQELFSAVVSQLYIDTYDSFTQRGFFRETPRSVHIRYKTVGITFQFFGVLVTTVASLFLTQEVPGLVVLGIGFFLAGSLLYNVAYRSVPLSKLGKELATQCAGFRSYLANPTPLEPSSVIARDFFHFVPYALAVDVGQAWLNRFRNHTHWEIPDWYADVNLDFVRPDEFVNQIDYIAHTLALALESVKDPNVD